MLGYYSHEKLNFPIVGSNESTISLPEIDLWSIIPSQNTVESVSYDHIYSENGNLLATSPELRFHSRPSVLFTDLG